LIKTVINKYSCVHKKFMNIEKFTEKMGKLIKATNAIYYTFEPKELPGKINYDEDLIKMLSDAILSLGNLSSMGNRLKNPHLLIMPYLKKEAILSSKIEGTRTSLEEIFLHEKKDKKPIDNDLQEVINYVNSMEYGLKEIQTRPIDENLIKELHIILMKGVRGESKDPGKYKIFQNWIGSSSDILEAKFIPASPETTPLLMKNLTDYLNGYEKVAELIKASLIHYQFETIHPFRDGNGRLGRLLIIIYLCKTKVLSQPLLYLSAYFEKYRDEYNQKLLDVSSKGDIENWIKFFLKGIKIQSDEALEKTSNLEDYREECRDLLQKKSNSVNVLRLLDYLFANPFITIPEAAKILDSYYPTAERNIKILVENGILEEFKGKRRARIFRAPKIMKILEIKN